jgi:hypothetical protein
MLGMQWSWRDLEDTPPYVRRYCWDFLMARRTAENEANERELRKAKSKNGN